MTHHCFAPRQPASENRLAPHIIPGKLQHGAPHWNWPRWARYAMLTTALLVQLSRAMPVLAGTEDLDTIRQRLLAPLLVAPNTATVSRLITTMRPDGSWPDVAYSDDSRSAWQVPQHLSRVRTLAQAYRMAPPGDDRSQDILNAAHKALGYWLRHDPQNTNWWWNQIGVPKTLLPVLLLLDKQLTADERARGLEIVRRAKIGMTGQNLVWVTEITAGRGILERDEQLVLTAYRRIADEIRMSTGEGIQPDLSFHQHGPCLYSHGYGASFVVDCAQIATQVEGTAMAFPRDKVTLLTRLILDGTAWMTRGSATDFGAEGREITRKGQSASHLAAAARYMLQLNTGREDEFRALAGRAAGDPTAPPLVGNRHFWCSDFMTHHRSHYYASARMVSNRLASTDGPANKEGLLSHHLADGCFVLMQDGREYRDIFGVWDWQKIPGTTVELEPELTGSPRRKGTRSFAGGVSDGMYGAAAFDLQWRHLAARKSWFFFDEEIVCLGAAITCDSDQPVTTTINQCFLRGDVSVFGSQPQRPIPGGHHTLELEPFDAVWHDHVAYVLLASAHAVLDNGPRTGSWHASNNRYPDTMESKNLFVLGIDHGTRPQSRRYAYVVIPGIRRDAVATRAAHRAYRVLSNSASLQAVAHESLKMYAAAFYSAGEVTTPEGLHLRVDQPCLLLAHIVDRDLALTASNPANEAATLRVTLATDSPSGGQPRVVTIPLPGGEQAGSSVTITVPLESGR